MKTTHGYVALYGKVGIEKVFCKRCQRFAFVIDGELRCCGSEATERPRKVRRECEGDFRKRHLSATEKSEQVDLQEGLCFYCGLDLGGYVFRNGEAIKIKIEWDHLIPFSYSRNNDGNNFVASCHICNRIKASLMFQTTEEALLYVRRERHKKGYL